MKTARGIKTGTRKLLCSREGQHLDFKEKIEALDIEDLAAFSNATGGTILLGVSQRGGNTTVVGCPWDDKAELMVRQKAGEADPPISIEISAENTAHGKAILRVDVPASVSRPHGSPRGVFKIRDGNKNRNLKPQELLAIFLESQGQTFISRFKAATHALEERLESVNREIQGLLMLVDQTMDQIEPRLSENLAHVKDVASATDDAIQRADEGASEASDAVEMLGRIGPQLEDILIYLHQAACDAGHDSPEIFRAKLGVRRVAMLTAAQWPDKDDEALLIQLDQMDKDRRVRRNLTAEQVREEALKGFTKGRANEGKDENELGGNIRRGVRRSPPRNPSLK